MGNFIFKSRRGLPQGSFSGYKRVVTHTHFDRTGTAFDANFKRLHDYCGKFDIAAVGVGSPWSPEATRAYRDNERARRNLYYSRPPEEADYTREEISGFIAALNRQGGVCYYLDNETPKGRNGHCWYYNFQYLYPAWHDYSQDRPVQYYWNDPHRETNDVTGEPHRRRPYYKVLSEQKIHGAVGVWAHPSSWWRNPDGSFVSNVAAEMPAHLVLDGGIGGMVVSGYDAFHRDYRAIYFMLLDQGYRIPAFAETDLTPLAIKDKLVIVNSINIASDELSAPGIARAAASGDCYIGSGIDIALELDGSPMGSSVVAVKGRRRKLRVKLRCAAGEKYCSRLEINSRGGAAVAVLEKCPDGVYEFEFDDDGEYAYFSACAFGEHEDWRKRQQEISIFAMTNPVYLIPRGFELPKPGMMECLLRFRDDSFFLGWSLRVNGEKKTCIVRPGERRLRLPANAEIELTSPNGRVEKLYPFFEDAQVQKLISYLSEGGFLGDFPDRQPGEIPTAAFDPRQWQALLPHIVAEL